MKVMGRTVTQLFQRRATLRHEVSVRGAIIDGSCDPARTIGCGIVDLSLGGAKIELDEDCPLPDRVMLYESSRENVYECSIRWRDGRTIGLGFVDIVSLSARRALISEASQGVVESMRESSETGQALE
jgi:hypothetical protein